MSGQKNRYDWTTYYMTAYEEERKRNTVLAGRIADAERKQADAQDNLNRICANPLYKMAVKAASPARGLVRRMKGISGAADCASAEATEEQRLRYEEELWRQSNPYLQWIEACENKNTGVIKAGEPIAVQGLREITVPGTDILILTYGEGLLSWNVFSEVSAFFAKNTECLLAYADEDFYWEDLTKRMEPWFKPIYSPDTLLAFAYWGHFLAVKTGLLDSMSYRMVNMKDPDAGFYELCLRLEEKIAELTGGDFVKREGAIGHIESVLYHRTYQVPDTCARELEQAATWQERFLMVQACLRQELSQGRFLAGASKRCVSINAEALLRRGLRATQELGADPDIYHLLYDTSVSGRERCTRSGSENMAIAPHRVVSVVIPSKDHPEVLERCLRSFREKTRYTYYEWIVVDNGSSDENREKMEALQKTYGFAYLYEPMPFHFSKMCNLGVKQARGDLILLMNDDMEIIEGSWLERMVGQALQPHVGAVGAKLWYADTQQIQHAGVTNLVIGPSHKLVTFPDGEDYYYGRNRVTYNVAAVTGACLMVTRKKYEEAGGLDEGLPVSYNDVDFCFKMLEAGYVNVLRNDAILYHHESLSRGLDEQDEGKWERLLAEKEALYERHPKLRGKDPFYHKNLIDNASDYRCNFKFPHEDRLVTQEGRYLLKSALRRLVKRAQRGQLRLTVDLAELQHKIHADEPDIFWIMGWSYLPGTDNAAFKREVVLQRTDGAGYLAVPVDWHRKDVEAILPEEKHIGLAGFVLRMRREELAAGEYRIGMLASTEAVGETEPGMSFVAWSESKIKVE
ncbi:MAG: glycosyltransferase family 2 protein [Lachnospiraceae bacterium]|nr:glycosyltransferase family 2 protein [Lachnospiraceae bacterium]